MSYEDFIRNIKNKKLHVGIIGMGYVGLPLAILFAKKGYFVTGFVRTEEKAKILQGGRNTLSDKNIDKDLKDILKAKKFIVRKTNPADLQRQDVIIICVPTPVNTKKEPDITDLKTVAKQLGKIDISGKLLINESTVAPFMTRNVFSFLGSNFYFATSPERIDPGNKDFTTENISKVIGARDERSLRLAKELYSKILKRKVITVGSLEEAEMTKMLENTYRAVNIGLINEFAKLADRCNVDILNVIKAASTKWSFQAHYPSIGVGGHCIPVDPYYILKLAKSKGLKMDLVQKSLSVNEKMPEYIAKKVVKNYKRGMKILLYGITYKRNVNDLRESPSVHFSKILKKKRIPFVIYDPYIPPETISSLGFKHGNIEIVDMLIIGTDHDDLKKDSKILIDKNTIVIDGRNYFKSKKGKAVIGIGRSIL